MLNIVEAQLPQGPAQWETVQVMYNSSIPKESGWTLRDVESIRRKFKMLRSVQKPTGDPYCPPSVVRAKRIQRAIESAMGVCDLENDDGSGHGDVDEASENDHENVMDSTMDSDNPVATQRTGLLPGELIALGKASGASPIMSHTAQRRRKIDDMLAVIADNQEKK